jgi:hypothetical protein
MLRTGGGALARRHGVPGGISLVQMVTCAVNRATPAAEKIAVGSVFVRSAGLRVRMARFESGQKKKAPSRHEEPPSGPCLIGGSALHPAPNAAHSTWTSLVWNEN